jgi:putative polyhydroxyalkanoate system protein
MADININKSHNLEISDARARLEKMAGELQSQYGIRSAWTGNTATLSGTGLKKGVVELTDRTINVQITLGLLAKAMKGRAQAQINIALDNALS